MTKRFHVTDKCELVDEFGTAAVAVRTVGGSRYLLRLPKDEATEVKGKAIVPTMLVADSANSPPALAGTEFNAKTGRASLKDTVLQTSALAAIEMADGTLHAVKGGERRSPETSFFATAVCE